MSKPHRILATAFVAAIVAATPASASPLAHGEDFLNPTCGGPSEIVVCKPPLKVHVAPTDSLVLKTCGGPNEIVECRRPVD
jgi:hypothetical protein